MKNLVALAPVLGAILRPGFTIINSKVSIAGHGFKVALDSFCGTQEMGMNGVST